MFAPGAEADGSDVIAAGWAPDGQGVGQGGPAVGASRAGASPKDRREHGKKDEGADEQIDESHGGRRQRGPRKKKAGARLGIIHHILAQLPHPESAVAARPPRGIIREKGPHNTSRDGTIRRISRGEDQPLAYAAQFMMSQGLHATRTAAGSHWKSFI
ncbi:MAG: hypothetical protein DCC65_03570 [Planctomycetota bacterium]|nr:MAG: hypothetical protein DCC65_03570 [Planctomycetota bacterium]